MYWHVGRERHWSIETHSNTRDAIRSAVKFNLAARRDGEPEDFTVQPSIMPDPIMMEEPPPYE